MTDVAPRRRGWFRASVLFAGSAVACAVLTVASGDYTSVLAAACACAAVSLVAGLLAWRRVALVLRVVLVVVALADVAVMVDAVQRELSAARALATARAARLDDLRRADPWSNSPTWCADVSGRVVRTRFGTCRTRIVELGELELPKGRLALCDPSEPAAAAAVAQVPPGRCVVTATLADFSSNFDGADERVAYASVRIAPGVEAYRAPFPLAVSESARSWMIVPDGAGYFVFRAATIALLDDEALATCLPPRKRWADEIFDAANEPESERRRADPANALRGVVNVQLPFAEHGENAVLFRGTGAASVVGGYDAESRLVALHLDFGVVR